MRCVVTGGTGLVGSHLLPMLGRSHEVHATTRRARPAHEGVRWHDVDLASGDMSGLPSRADAVVYLAQSEHFREFPDHARDIFDVNVAGVARFLDYTRSAEARIFVLASSGGVYPPGDAAVKESRPVTARADMGFYAASKLCAEIVAQQYAAQFTVVILRFFFVYGPGQQEHMLVPRLVRSVLEGKPITLAGDHGIRINPTYADDAARAVTRALELDRSECINVAGPDVVTLREIATTIGDVVGREPVFTIDRATAPRHLFADIERMVDILGAPTTRLRDGIARLTASMRQPTGQSVQ